VLQRYVLEVSILSRPDRGRTRMSTTGPEATSDYSSTSRASGPAGRGVSGGRDRRDSGPLGPLGAALAVLAFAGSILCVVATFSPVIRIRVLTVDRASYSGFDRHSVALIVLGAFALAMATGGLRGARPAMAALAACGLVVVLISIIGDLPHLNDAGVWPQADAFEDARARAGAGYYLETLAGILLLVSGVGMLLLARASAPAPRHEA
jgi:hypothetical protein